MSFLRVLTTEFHKLRRSKITWLTWLAFSIMPVAGSLFIWIAKDPLRAERLGLLGQKAELAGVSADWPSYFALLTQISGVGGMVLLSIIAAFVFGREYSERTAKYQLALPVARHWFVVAKLVVIFAWFGALLLSAIAEGFAVGALLHIPGFTTELALSSVGNFLLAGLLGFLLVPIITWITAIGRGYLAPIGFTVFMLVMGNVLGTTGWGKWFPWSIVPMLAGMAGPRVDVLTVSSLTVVSLTFAVGVAATILQFRYADTTQ